MNTNELRLGNYITLAHESNQPVCKVQLLNTINENLVIDSIGRSYITTSELMLPIKLTKEWLEKFGFKPGPDKNTMQLWYDLESSNIGKERIVAHFENKAWNAGAEYHYKPIIYVHQLQNLIFILTGKEPQL